MAPEIVEEKSYNEKVDVWSVGVIAHILLTGCPPFIGKSKLEIYKSIVNDHPNFGKARGALSTEALTFVISALRKDPEKRATCDELLNSEWLTENVSVPDVDPEIALEITKNLSAFRK